MCSVLVKLVLGRGKIAAHMCRNWRVILREQLLSRIGITMLVLHCQCTRDLKLEQRAAKTYALPRYMLKH